MKRSFKDRNEVLTDPNFNKIPLGKLLSKASPAAIAESIDVHIASDITTQSIGSGTAHAAIVDKEDLTNIQCEISLHTCRKMVVNFL